MKIDQLRRYMQLTSFPNAASLIETLAERCIGFDANPIPEDQIPTGCSKMGGDPDMPEEMEWPTFNGRPMDFLMQVNLSELNMYSRPKPLPEAGMLYFFYDSLEQRWGFAPEDRESWQVLFAPNSVRNLVQRPYPGETTVRFTPCRISFYEAFSDGWSTIPVFYQKMNAYELQVYSCEIDDFPDGNGHQILGHPAALQSGDIPMRQQCQFVSNGLYMGGGEGPIFDENRAEELEPGAKDWILILQLDSDERAGMQWGDRGRLFFWIRRQDLERCDFSNVWMILESY